MAKNRMTEHEFLETKQKILELKNTIGLLQLEKKDLQTKMRLHKYSEHHNEEDVFDCPFKVGDVVIPAENADLDLPENTKKLTIVKINSNGKVDVVVDTDDDDHEDGFVWKWRLSFVNPQNLKPKTFSH